MYAPLCGIFCPNSVAVARYGSFLHLAYEEIILRQCSRYLVE
ncbi:MULTISPECIES: DUF6783 domain-containing protein [Clostridia]